MGSNAPNGIDNDSSSFYETTSNVGDYWEAKFKYAFEGQTKKISKVRILNRTGTDSQV